jgi:hypothetical protein
VSQFISDHGALTVALVSGLTAAALAFIPLPRLKWLLVGAAPLAIAVAIYWTPVWRGADPAEYSAWALAMVVPWYGAGLLTALPVCFLVGKARARRSSSA